jgi:DNA-binding LacI/PurR family transcriptional regulator
VLNEHPSIRDTTKARVREVMDELHYRPNRAARALSKGRSRTIGVLSSSSGQYAIASSIAAIQDAAREAGYFVDTANLADTDAGSIADALTHLQDQDIEGLIVIAPQKRVFDVIATLTLDVPWVNLHSEGYGLPHALATDQIEGARLATRHLIELGHRDILHLAGPQDWSEAEARMRGFLQEIGDAELATSPPILGDWTAEFGYYAGRELVRYGGFTAVFAASDQMALGLLHAFRDAGLDTPRDVSVVGFDDVPDARHFFPPLTTVRQDFTAIGRRAVALVLGEVQPDEVVSGAPVVTDLIIRDSTGPVSPARRPVT